MHTKTWSDVFLLEVLRNVRRSPLKTTHHPSWRYKRLIWCPAYRRRQCRLQYTHWRHTALRNISPKVSNKTSTNCMSPHGTALWDVTGARVSHTLRYVHCTSGLISKLDLISMIKPNLFKINIFSTKLLQSNYIRMLYKDLTILLYKSSWKNETLTWKLHKYSMGPAGTLWTTSRSQWSLTLLILNNF